MSDAAQIFNEAYQLIEQGDLASARQLLDEVRSENEDNPDFWWLYAHAVEDAAEGRDALNRVRQLRPDYPGLNNLLEQTDTTTPSPIRPLRPPTTLPDMPNQTPDDDFGDDFEADEKPVGSNRRNLYLAAAGTIIAVVVIAALLMFALPGGDDVIPTATTILVLPTTEAPFATVASIDVTEDIIEMTEDIEPTEEDIEPTDDVTEIVEPTEAEATPTEEDIEPTEDIETVDVTEVVEPTEEDIEPTDVTEDAEPTEQEAATEVVAEDVDYSAFAAQVLQFNVPDDGVEVAETMLGNTLLVTTCSPPGPTATQSILGILTVLQDESVGDAVEAVGFRIANCNDDTTIRIIGVSREQFDDYVDGTISAQQLQSSMRPIG